MQYLNLTVNPSKTFNKIICLQVGRFAATLYCAKTGATSGFYWEDQPNKNWMMTLGSLELHSFKTLHKQGTNWHTGKPEA